MDKLCYNTAEIEKGRENMKKIALFLAFVMLLGCFVGCSKNKENKEPSTEPTESIPYEGELDHVHAPGEHVYVTEVLAEADCVNSGKILHICAVCGEGFEEIVDPYGHEFEPATCDRDGYCINCGIVLEKALGHSPLHGICERCRAVVE